ncbi:zinc ribbon-containing protein [Cellvibrio polysaccharolyticus]|nr:hypothetical protein [Cellvibrio polysaccharolyticus]
MMSTERYQNPYHEETQNSSIHVTLQQGIEHDVGQLVSLELTAESMFQEEAALLGAYVREDLAEARTFWGELKEDFHTWEISAGEMLLSVADPSRTEWHRSGLWKSHEDEEFTDKEFHNRELPDRDLH